MKSSVGSATATVLRSTGDTRLRRRQGLTLGLLVCGYAGYYLCRSDFSVALPMIMGDLSRNGLDPATAQIRMGRIASLGVLAYALGKIPSGTLADFLGGRSNFLLGMVGAAVFTLWFAGSSAIPILAIAWIGNRLVQTLGWAGMVKITGKWFSYRWYGTAMAIVSLSYLFGDALARRFLALLITIHLTW